MGATVTLTADGASARLRLVDVIRGNWKDETRKNAFITGAPASPESGAQNQYPVPPPALNAAPGGVHW